VTYRYRRVPAYEGQLHLKTWAFVIAPTGAHDPQWVKKAVEYWQLQAETFGIRYEPDVQIMVDYQHGCVTTAAHVAEVLPGPRTRDYVVPRVAEARLLEKLEEATQ
jgi:hypothetical protein